MFVGNARESITILFRQFQGTRLNHRLDSLKRVPSFSKDGRSCTNDELIGPSFDGGTYHWLSLWIDEPNGKIARFFHRKYDRHRFTGFICSE